MDHNLLPISANYQIYRSLNESIVFSYIGSTTQNNFTYTDTNVALHTTYYYVVRAVNSVGEGVDSQIASRELESVPSAPQNLQAKSSDLQIQLSWSAPKSDGVFYIQNYSIFRSTTDGSGYVYLNSTINLNYLDSGLTNGTTYYYVVEAINELGPSNYSIQASATPEIIIPPTPQTTTISNPSTSLPISNPSTSSGSSNINLNTSGTAQSESVTKSGKTSSFGILSLIGAIGLLITLKKRKT